MNHFIACFVEFSVFIFLLMHDLNPLMFADEFYEAMAMEIWIQIQTILTV